MDDDAPLREVEGQDARGVVRVTRGTRSIGADTSGAAGSCSTAPGPTSRPTTSPVTTTASPLATNAIVRTCMHTSRPLTTSEPPSARATELTADLDAPVSELLTFSRLDAGAEVQL